MGFTDEETEAPSGGVTCLKSQSQQGSITPFVVWYQSPNGAVMLLLPVTPYCPPGLEAP